MAELSLGVVTPGLSEAVRAYGALTKAQQAAFDHTTGLKDRHKELAAETRRATADMAAGWRGIASELGLVTTAGAGVLLMLSKAREAWQEYQRLTQAGAKAQESFAGAYNRLAQTPELVAQGAVGRGQAQRYREFALGLGERGVGAPTEIMQALTAGAGTGAHPEQVMAAVEAGAHAKRLTPDTSIESFALATLQGRAAGYGQRGAENLAVMAGKGGAGTLGRLRATSTATGISLPHLMAMQDTLADELQMDEGEVLGMVQRAVAAGVSPEEMMSGKISKRSLKKMKGARTMALAGALTSGRASMQGAMAAYDELAGGRRALLAEGYAGVSPEGPGAINAETWRNRLATDAITSDFGAAGQRVEAVEARIKLQHRAIPWYTRAMPAAAEEAVGAIEGENRAAAAAATADVTGLTNIISAALEMALRRNNEPAAAAQRGNKLQPLHNEPDVPPR